LGGGGHHNAAGAILTGEFEVVQEKVFVMIDQLLS
jgi:nanoRNase/pAp phosphatase (c-di-AMP/oligoRNAs hydrolase)